MCQPNGYNNGSGQVCKLIKTLYELKQSSWEWNAKFDEKIHKQGFQWLLLKLCTYTHSINNEITVITIWVDDLLLFANLAETMEKMKKKKKKKTYNKNGMS